MLETLVQRFDTTEDYFIGLVIADSRIWDDSKVDAGKDAVEIGTVIRTVSSHEVQWCLRCDDW